MHAVTSRDDADGSTDVRHPAPRRRPPNSVATRALRSPAGGGRRSLRAAEHRSPSIGVRSRRLVGRRHARPRLERDRSRVPRRRVRPNRISAPKPRTHRSAASRRTSRTSRRDRLRPTIHAAAWDDAGERDRFRPDPHVRTPRGRDDALLHSSRYLRTVRERTTPMGRRRRRDHLRRHAVDAGLRRPPSAPVVPRRPALRDAPGPDPGWTGRGRAAREPLRRRSRLRLRRRRSRRTPCGSA